jgi:hypothetical protein
LAIGGSEQSGGVGGESRVGSSLELQCSLPSEAVRARKGEPAVEFALTRWQPVASSASGVNQKQLKTRGIVSIVLNLFQTLFVRLCAPPWRSMCTC